MEVPRDDQLAEQVRGVPEGVRKTKNKPVWKVDWEDIVLPAPNTKKLKALKWKCVLGKVVNIDVRDMA